jgi:hypothetical protein
MVEALITNFGIGHAEPGTREAAEQLPFFELA